MNYIEKIKSEYKSLPRVQRVYFISIIGCIISFFIGLFADIFILVEIGIGGGMGFCLAYLFVEYFKIKGKKYKS